MKKGILASLTAMTGAAAGAAAAWKVKGKSTDEYREYADKHLEILLMYNQWLLTKQEGKSIVSYFKEQGYKEIAVYGMSHVGERLLDELKGSEVTVKYAIDRNADNIYAAVDVVQPDGKLDKVDAVVVTANYYFDDIEKIMCEKVDCPILNLEDILYEI